MQRLELVQYRADYQTTTAITFKRVLLLQYISMVFRKDILQET